MPARAESAAITGTYRGALLALRERAIALVGNRWRLIDWLDLDRSFAEFLAAAGETVALSQREAVRLTDAYLAAYLSSELGEAVPPQGLDPASFAGRTRDGRPVARVLTGALFAVKLAILQRRPREQALASGLAHTVRTVRTEVMESSRSALAEAIAREPRVRGWRRVTAGRPCGACLGLAGGLRRTDRGLDVHPSCRCTAEPVLAGVEERFPRPSGRELFDAMTPEEQDALFAGSGGAAKADLIRSGKAQLADLIARDERPQWGTVIAEAPLEALTH